MRRCEIINHKIEEFAKTKKSDDDILVIPVRNCLHENVNEILRLFYCREISIDVSDDRAVDDLKTLALGLFRQQDLDFAMTKFLRDQKFMKQAELDPFKVPNRPLKPNAFKTKMENAKKSGIGSKIEIKEKSSRFDPFGSLAKVNKKADQPKKEKIEINNNADKGNSQQILDGFLKDCQDNIGKYQENTA